MTGIKRNICDILIIVVLLTLIIIRIVLHDKECSWINAINFAGIIIAYASLFIEIYSENKTLEKINFFVGISVLILIALAVVEVFVILNMIKISTLGNDLITLITLLISLPVKFQKKIIVSILS